MFKLKKIDSHVLLTSDSLFVPTAFNNSVTRLLVRIRSVLNLLQKRESLKTFERKKIYSYSTINYVNIIYNFHSTYKNLTDGFIRIQQQKISFKI